MRFLTARAFPFWPALCVLVLASTLHAEPGDGPERPRGKRPQRRAAQEPEKLVTPQMVSPGFVYQHIRAGRRVFDIRARKAETYPDQDLVLTGVDEIKIYGANGKTSLLRADFGRWRSKAGDFELWGNVSGNVLMEDPDAGEQVHFETERLVYRETWKAVTTLRPVLLETSSITTTGTGLHYNLLTQEVTIGSDVVTTMQVDDPKLPAGDVVITSGHLSLDPNRRIAVYTKSPLLRMADNQMSGDRMEFFLAPGEQRLEVEGSVKGRFRPESLAPAKEETPPTAAEEPAAPVDVSSTRAIFHSPSRTATFLGSVVLQRPGEKLSCGKMVLLMNQEGHQLESALAEEAVEVIRPEGTARGGRLTYRYSTDEGLLSQAPQLLLPEGRLTAQLIHFRRDGSILGERRVLLRHEPAPPRGRLPAAASGSALDLHDGAPVDIRSERLNYAPALGYIVFEDGVRVTRPGSKLETQKLTLQTEASGRFRSLLAERDVRLRSDARLFTGDRLHYDLDSRQALLEGLPAQARTAEEFVTAKAMSFSGSSSEYSARDTVSIQLNAPATQPGRPRASEPQPVRATCGRAHFGGNGRRVELAEEVHLDKPDEQLKLRSDEVDLYLLESREISELLARGGVQINHAQGSAQGDVARYTAENRKLEIEGKSVKIVHQGRQSFPQRAVLHLDTSSVDFFGQQGRVRTILPIEPVPR